MTGLYSRKLSTRTRNDPRVFNAAGTVVMVPLARSALAAPLTSLRDQNTLTLGVVSSVISIAVTTIFGVERL